MVERSPRGQYLPFVAAVLAGAALPAWAAGAAPARPVASSQLHAWEAGEDRGPSRRGCTSACAAPTPISGACWP